MKAQGIQAEDILADNQNTAEFNGMLIRKGTVAAFLANIAQLEAPHTTTNEKIIALETIRELAPAIVNLGLLQYVTFKNPTVQKILMDIDQ